MLKDLYLPESIHGMTNFCKKLKVALNKLDKKYVVTYDIPYDPRSLQCVTGRCLDWVSISKVIDHVYVMSYDAQLEGLFGEVTDPFERISSGIDKFFNNGIAHEKLVHLVPWYNCLYKCYNSPSKTTDTCYTNVVTRQTEIDICTTFQLLKNNNVPGEPFYDQYQQGYKTIIKSRDLDGVYQLWYDTPATLYKKLKRNAINHKLGGIGFWYAGGNDFSDEKCRDEYLNKYFKLMSNVKNEMKNESKIVFDSDKFVVDKL